MSQGINIEIMGNYKERYSAKIHSFSGENELIIKFDDNPELLCKVPINSVFFVSENASKSFEYKVGTEVLALQNVDDCNTSVAQFNARLSKAWWPAKIDKVKGDFAAIQYINKDNGNINDIVELTKLRPMNDGRPLLRSDIRIHEMVVPDDLCDFCEQYDVRGDLNRWCGPAIVVNFDKVNKKLQIFSTDQEVVRKACLLDASFMRVLRQKKRVYMQKVELTKRLNDTIKNQYTEEFSVDKEFIGLAIGTQGCNIKKAREIDGIISIDLNDYTHTFTISAHTQEAVKAARAQLEYMKKIFYVPMDIVSKVIGKNGNQIHDIIDQSGIMRVRVVEGPDLNNWSDEENMLADHVPFVFVGSANSIRDACLLLEFSIEYHRDIDRLQKERDEIDREIRNSQINLSRKLPGHSASDRENEHFHNEPSRGYNSRGRQRGRNNYRNVSNSDIDQHNDSFNDDPTIVQQKFRGNGRMGPLRRGVGGYRQGSLPPTVNGQHNGTRRYRQYDDDTDEYGSATNESESNNGRNGGGQPRYRGHQSRGGFGGTSSGGNCPPTNNNNRPYYNNQYNPLKPSKLTTTSPLPPVSQVPTSLSTGSTAPPVPGSTEDTRDGHRRRNGDTGGTAANHSPEGLAASLGLGQC